ncbi:MAG: molecular chaperone TorD family protein [Armatimonadetes bacterium]|nr:molecular chaperone TorD family protein [Armatimonadota bacterium]
MTSNAQLVDEALGLAVLYRLLASMALYPEPASVARLRDADTKLMVSEALKAIEADERLELEISRMLTTAAGISPMQWQSEYISVFGHAASKDCSPYASDYGVGSVFQQAQKLADLSAFYSAFGLQTQREERADHIAVELEFMGYLCHRKAVCIAETKSDEDAAQLEAAREAFLRQFLAPWAFSFCGLVAKTAEAVESQLFLSWSGAVESLLAMDRDRLGINATESVVNLQPLPPWQPCSTD